ncbi:MAG: NAD-dependent epimerase/dehydratase family protein [Bacteroidales bacterium]
MKILITGGAGFIGSNLCEYFLNLGNKKYVILVPLRR